MIRLLICSAVLSFLRACEEQIPSRVETGRAEQVIQQKCPCLATRAPCEKVEAGCQSQAGISGGCVGR